LLFNVLAMVAEFEADLARARSREGMAVAKAKGRLRGKKPKLKANQEAHLVDLWRAGGHTTIELAEMFDVARSTVYRAIERAGERAEGTASSPTPVKSRPPFAVRRLSVGSGDSAGLLRARVALHATLGRSFL
jgi:DNA invertase Pin-like site-specific DNA recombinase